MGITRSLAAALAAMSLLSAATAFARTDAEHPTCIYTQDVLRDHIQDDRTIDFRMKDGTVWRNVLPMSCHGLKLYGFAFVTRQARICSRMSIEVRRAPNTCLLGSFTRLKGEPRF